MSEDNPYDSAGSSPAPEQDPQGLFGRLANSNKAKVAAAGVAAAAIGGGTVADRHVVNPDTQQAGANLQAVGNSNSETMYPTGDQVALSSQAGAETRFNNTVLKPNEVYRVPGSSITMTYDKDKGIVTIGGLVQEELAHPEESVGVGVYDNHGNASSAAIDGPGHIYDADKHGNPVQADSNNLAVNTMSEGNGTVRVDADKVQIPVSGEGIIGNLDVVENNQTASSTSFDVSNTGPNG
jgi:hypothetical protein